MTKFRQIEVGKHRVTDLLKRTKLRNKRKLEWIKVDIRFRDFCFEGSELFRNFQNKQTLQLSSQTTQLSNRKALKWRVRKDLVHHKKVKNDDRYDDQ